MALLHCNIFSDALELCTSVDLILPQPSWALAKTQKPFKPIPTLWLLHGLSDDHTIWQRRTSIERYVEGKNLAVVMPAVERSFYSDMAYGGKFWTYISEELPYVLRRMFGLSEARADNFVAGLSMGGYGAFRLALSHPDRYAAAASLSGAVDIRDVTTIREDEEGYDPRWKHEMQMIFGDLSRVPGSEVDLFTLAEKLAKEGKYRLPLFTWCGKEDFLYAANLKFKALAEKLGLDLTYSEGPGDHQWMYWDREIQNVLNWLPLK